MLKLELAGQTINYKNALDLPRRVSLRLNSLRERRAEFDKEIKTLRAQEMQLERFLGGRGAPTANSSSKEEVHE